MCTPGAWREVKKKDLACCLRRPCQCVNEWVLEMQRLRNQSMPTPTTELPETLEEKR